MINIITTCPACHSPLVREKDQLFCRNDDCIAKNSRVVEKYCKKVKIKGLGEASIEKLGLASISDIYDLELDYLVNILGKNGEKVFNEIQAKKEIPLQLFLGAQSIPLVGESTSSKITKDIEDITFNSLKKDGFGDKAATNLIEWLDTTIITDKIKFTKNEIKANLSPSFKVCISGKIPGMTKAVAASMLAEYNIAVVNTVNKDIKYLISESKPSVKTKKAETLNIPVISIGELEKELKN